MLESNKLIVEFLGWETYDDGTFNTPFEWVDNFASMSWNKYRNDFEAENMLFNSDWNWLMLVVDKIDNGSGEHIKLSCNIKDVYVQCVKFIKWYNENGR